jgi:hypothetical protein
LGIGNGWKLLDTSLDKLGMTRGTRLHRGHEVGPDGVEDFFGDDAGEFELRFLVD